MKSSKYWDTSWNPIRVKGGGYHCTKCSDGCLNCWSEKYNNRFGNKIPFDNRPVEFEIDKRVLEQPLHWKKPRIVAVQWLGDLFHEDIEVEFQGEVCEIIKKCPQHIFLLLTKRIKRMATFFPDFYNVPQNCWPGVTICNQVEADEKIPEFLKVPGKKWLSFEPLLSGVNMPNLGRSFCKKCGCSKAGRHIECTYCGSIIPDSMITPGVDFVVVGAETGPCRRPCNPFWIKSIVEQCREAGIPCFVKQISIAGHVLSNIDDFPEELRVSQTPWR